jgi:F420-dependent methylenetetrahydromethanopterin dehydrogenase
MRVHIKSIGERYAYAESYEWAADRVILTKSDGTSFEVPYARLRSLTHSVVEIKGKPTHVICCFYKVNAYNTGFSAERVKRVRKGNADFVVVKTPNGRVYAPANNVKIFEDENCAD